jgi:uncharacterized protein YecE (DUF72 family)
VTGSARVGISGWQYARWRGDFYPRGLPQRAELSYAASMLSTIEVNASFYSLGRPSTYRRWYDEVPAQRLLAVKGGRFVTHMRRLRDVRTPVANFFASGVLALEDKLGPVLWQLPADLTFDAALVDRFLGLLPRDTAAAKRLARAAATLPAGRTWLERSSVRPLRHALEVRHETYRTPDFAAVLREHHVAMVVADSAGTWPRFDDVTTDFVYVRLHGHERLYGGGYPPAVLREWAHRVRAWNRSGRDVYVYFDNDADGRAPFDARALAEMVGDVPVQEVERAPQPRRRSRAVDASRAG